MQEGSSPVEHYFECALQAAHSGAKGGSIQCAALFAHFADELGLKGGIIYVQNLTKGVAKEAWRDPSQDWLPGDPYRLPCELASDPGVKLCTLQMHVCPVGTGCAAGTPDTHGALLTLVWRFRKPFCTRITAKLCCRLDCSAISTSC